MLIQKFIIMQSLKRIYLLLAACLLLLCNACNKNDSFNTAELHVYAAPGTLAYNVIEGNFNMVGTRVFAGPGTSFPVLLSRPVDRDIQVQVSIDTSLVRVYDSIYKSSSPSAKLPDGAFNLQQNGLLTIPAGKTASSATAQVELKNAALVKEGVTYIIPIVINNANNDVPVSAARNIIFLKTQLKLITAGISTWSNANTMSVVLNKANNTITGPGALYLKGLLNDPLSGNSEVTIEAAPSLLAAYNQQTGRNYIPMPAASYQLQKTSVTIPESALNSADSIVISLPNLQLFQTGNDYLLPIQIKTAKNQSADIGVSPTQKVVYIHVYVFENNIDASNSGLTGTTISRAGWVATASSAYFDTYGASKAIDGNNNSIWLAIGVPNWLQVNMGVIKTVKGFNINTADLGFLLGDILEMEVLASDDGTLWKLQGKFKSEASDTKVVKFITPVTAQYFRFNITKTADSFYSAMSELNAVE